MTDQHRGSVLLLTLSLMTALAVLVVTFSAMVKSNIALNNGQASAVRAFYIAEAGLNKAIWYLLNTAPDSTSSATWRTSAYPSQPDTDPNDPQEESYEGGDYVMWVEDSGGDILVTSRGRFRGVTRTVHQQVNIIFTPHALRYPVFSGGDIDLDISTGSINGSTASRGNSIIPAGVTVNGSVIDNSSVNAPIVDVSGYEAMADTVISGDHTFSSGTYNGVWYVDGDVFIESDVNVTGAIIATGNIDLQGQSNITIVSLTSTPALLSSTNILADNATAVTLDGLVYAAGEIILNNITDLDVNGAIMAGSRVVAQNATNLSIVYNSQIFSSPPPLFTDNSDSKTLTVVPGSWGLN